MPTWDTAFEEAPDINEDRSLGASRIQETKEAVRERAEKESVWGSGADSGFHVAGAARAFLDDTSPTQYNTPASPDTGGGGDTLFGHAAASGRLWVDNTAMYTPFIHTGVAFVQIGYRTSAYFPTSLSATTHETAFGDGAYTILRDSADTSDWEPSCTVPDSVSTSFRVKVEAMLCFGVGSNRRDLQIDPQIDPGTGTYVSMYANALSFQLDEQAIITIPINYTHHTATAGTAKFRVRGWADASGGTPAFNKATGSGIPTCSARVFVELG